MYAPKMTRTRRVNNRTLVIRAGAGETDGNVKFANNKAEFEAVSATAGAGLVAVQISTKTCGPCKVIAPVLEEIAAEYDGKMKVCKLDIDANGETPPKYGIRGIPTLMLFKNGNVEATKVGALSKSQLTAFLDSNI